MAKNKHKDVTEGICMYNGCRKKQRDNSRYCMEAHHRAAYGIPDPKRATDKPLVDLKNERKEV